MRATKIYVDEPTPAKVEVKKEEIKPSKPLMDEEAIQNIVKECLENHPLIKELKNTIDNQKSEISVLKNKNDMLLEKVKTYKEEADKLDKMVADRKKELYSEIFGGV
jgi:chromosome segregation ATPase